MGLCVSSTWETLIPIGTEKKGGCEEEMGGQAGHAFLSQMPSVPSSPCSVLWVQVCGACVNHICCLPAGRQKTDRVRLGD